MRTESISEPTAQRIPVISECSAQDQTQVKLPQVCHVIASINEHIGGPALSVTSLAEATTVCNIKLHLLTLNYPSVGAQIKPQNVELHSYPATLTTRYLRGFQPTAKRGLDDLAATKLDLIHNHGIWMFPNLYARQAAKRSQLPLVISPRGMLEAWSLNRSQLQKRIAWRLYEKENLLNATAFHATSIDEAHSIRQLGFTQPIAIIPNGVTVPKLDSVGSRELLTDRFPELKDKRWLLFLSRLHPKKGLDTLLSVWHTLHAQFPDWQLVIAGPDLIGYQADLVKLTAELNLQHCVTFTGMLSGNDKTTALSHAELMVLPSHSENFGIAIAEALAYGMPVITTHGTPWQGLHPHDCGWWIENNAKTLAKTLTEAMQLSDSTRRSMGQNGRRWMIEQYSWSAIAQSMSEVYRWILNGGNLPASVQVR